MASRSSHSTLVILTLVGAVAGGVVGYLAPIVMLSISIIGQLFINALKLIFIPLVISTVIVSMSALSGFRKLGRAARTTLLYFGGTTALAVCIGMILVTVIQPGQGTSHTAATGWRGSRPCSRRDGSLRRARAGCVRAP